MPDIRLTDLCKTFPNGAVGLHPTTLHIPDATYFVLLGPSGSGKTTLLRLVAGLETADGVEHVGLPLDEAGAVDRLRGEMEWRTFDEQTSYMPGRLFQSIRQQKNLISAKTPAEIQTAEEKGNVARDHLKEALNAALAIASEQGRPRWLKIQELAGKADAIDDRIRAFMKSGATDQAATLSVTEARQVVNELDAGLTRIGQDLSAYYLLGYYSTNTKNDLRFRKIDVKVKTPDAILSARRWSAHGKSLTRKPSTTAGQRRR